MRVSTSAALMGAAVLTMTLLPGIARSQDIVDETLSAQLTSSRRQLDSALVGAPCDGSCDGCGAAPSDCGCGCNTCGSGRTLYAGFELAILQPHLGNLSAGTDFGNFRLAPKFESEASPRIWLGAYNCDGFGGRVRYWQFDHDATGESVLGDLFDFVVFPADGTFSLDLNVQAVDFEMTQSGTFCSWDLEVAGGIRYGKLELGANVVSEFRGNRRLDGLKVGFEGVGPTVAMAARRPIGCRGLAVYGNARGSLLYGDSGLDGRGSLAGPLASLDIEADQHMMQVWEFQIGTEFTRTTRRGSTIALRGALEGQAWEWAPVLGLLGADIGFFGPTVAFEVRR